MFRIQSACGCHQGKVRVRNEDNFYFDGKTLPQSNSGMKEILYSEREANSPVCFAIFDGMGGEANGEEASYIAAQTLREYVDRGISLPADLVKMCLEANSKLCEAAVRRHAMTVGSTAAVLSFDTEWAHCANIGDSKVFLFRGEELRQLSVDHTDEAIMRRYGQSRPPRLTQYLGIPPDDMVIEPHTISIALRRGDWFLMCSDGLSDMVPNPRIQELLSRSASAQGAVEELVEAALSAGGRDNITTIVCVVGE